MKVGYGQVYTDLYHRHWWWQARRSIILSEISRLGLRDGAEILDVGCGNGLFLPDLARLGRVTGIETDVRLLSDATPLRDRIRTEPLGSTVYQGMKFDLITALDVIEHIKDDDGAVRGIMAMLKPGGVAIITVPALMSLWDEHDVENQHFRRYDRSQLLELLSRHGQVSKIRYFFNSLYLPKRAMAAVNRMRGRKISQAAIPGAAINTLMRAICLAEYRLTGAVSPPFGSSLLAVVRSSK